MSRQMEVVLVFISILLWVCAKNTMMSSNTESMENFLDTSKLELRKKYRPWYHVSLPFGWINNPAGFIYYKRNYHLFYQYHPYYDGRWGQMQWGHIVSENLVDWKHYPPVLLAENPYDRNGCFGGSVVLHNGYLAAFYTGHKLIGNISQNTLNVAISANSIVFKTYIYNPVRKFPDMDFKNVKVWHYKNGWYMLATFSQDEQGKLILFYSRDLYNWNVQSTVASSEGNMGHTWESPDIFDVNGFSVIILTIQGIEPEEYRFKNVYQAGYVVSKFNYSELKFEDLEVSTSTFTELDFGHDFSAPKVVTAPDGRRIIVAWLGMWESELHESKEGWAGMLTILREAYFGWNERLVTPPVQELILLREDRLDDAWYAPGESFHAGSKSFEMIVNSSSSAYDSQISFSWGKNHVYTITYWADRAKVSVDRGGKDGVRWADWAPRGTVLWRIFMDRSSIEVFCGDGEVVFSSRIYPRRTVLVIIGGDTRLHILQYNLRKSIGYDPKLLRHLNEQYRAQSDD